MGKVSGNGSVLILERPLPSLGRELAKFHAKFAGSLDL